LPSFPPSLILPLEKGEDWGYTLHTAPSPPSLSGQVRFNQLWAPPFWRD